MNTQENTSNNAENPVKRMKLSNEFDRELTFQNELKRDMILYLQCFYHASTDIKMTYQGVFTEFIEYQRTHPLPSLMDMAAITFDKYVAVVREAVDTVAFCHVLSSYDEPVNIAANASNTSDPTQRVMKIQRAPIANNPKPLTKRIHFISSRKN
eukprot:906981_1